MKYHKKLFRFSIAVCSAAVLLGGIGEAVFADDMESECENEGEIVYCAEGDKLVAECSESDYVSEQYVSIALEPYTEFYTCKTQVDIPVTDSGWADIEGPDYVMLYEGTGDTDYELTDEAPTESGDYTVSLCLEEAWDDGDEDEIEICRTTPVAYSIHAHDWSYSTSEYTVSAKCNKCGATASVTLDTSAVYEASRNCDTSGMKYELFYENNWDKYDDLARFSIVYYGYETNDDKTTTKYFEQTLDRPTNAGNYYVKIALLDNPNDLDTAFLWSKEKVFYVADIPISSCTIKDYGAEQIAKFTQPQKSGGYYQVGTLSELLWCVYHQTSDMCVELTNDIVVNPITVTDDGVTRSASYEVYRWKGFGTDSSSYTGSFYGNGYTIYGLYVDNQTYCSNGGLINWCRNGYVEGVTVENSYMKNVLDAGAIMGRLDLRKHDSSAVGADEVIDYCSSLNNYFSAKNQAGGIVGFLTSDCFSWASFTGCTNSSYVQGRWAGGILGRSDENDYKAYVLFFTKCMNQGTIRSTQYDAGGIIGSLNTMVNSLTGIYTCVNTGKIRGSHFCGGLIGYLSVENSYKCSCIIQNSVSTGNIDASSERCGGIIGACCASDYYKNGCIKEKNTYYYDASSPFPGLNMSGITFGTNAHVELTTKQVKNGYVCSMYGHQAAAHYSNVKVATCTSDGSMEKVCTICGQVMETKTMMAHGHYYQMNEKGDMICAFCGMSEDETSTASIFSKSAGFGLIVFGVAVLCAAAVGTLLVKRKRK